MQYSCQQNFTILSTDGYWNDSSNPTQLDGSTAIGQQDGNDPRPYYDGATQTRVETQTTRTDSQTGYNSKRVDKRTQQRQTTTQQISKTVTTTTTYDYTKQVSQLQKEGKAASANAIQPDQGDDAVDSDTSDLHRVHDQIFT